MTKIEGEAAPPTLDYGAQPRRRIPWGRIILGLGLGVALLVSGRFGWSMAQEILTTRAYNRDAAAWYAKAAHHRPPADELRYTEHPADAPEGGFRNGFAAFSDSMIDRVPAFTQRGPILFDPSLIQRGGVFTGERTTSAGLSRLLVITTSSRGVSQAPDGRILLTLSVDQIGPMPGAGWNEAHIRTLRGGSQEIDLTNVCGPGELRLFAGQPDPEDAARFSIPFEAGGRRGWIDGVFVPGQAYSEDPARRQAEREANSRVAWSVRLAEGASAPPAQSP